MKGLFLTLGAAFAVVSLSGCFVVNTNDAAVPATAIVQKDFKADIVAKDAKVSGEASVNALFGIFCWGVNEFADDAFVTTTNNSLIKIADPVAMAKQGAAYNACKDAKADYILGAKYQVDTKDFVVFKQISCKVVGFPAELKGVK